MKVNSINNTAPSFGNIGNILSKAANINSWQQRAALGVAAVSLQPVIDMHNKDVDEDTKKLSAIRSFSKAAVGTCTGIAVRFGCMKLVEAGFKNEKFTNTIAKITADGKTEEAIRRSKDFIKNGGAKKYSSVLGTIAALGVMLYTNFAVDAPLTNKLTNALSKKFENKDTAPVAGGANAN